MKQQLQQLEEIPAVAGNGRIALTQMDGNSNTVGCAPTVQTCRGSPDAPLVRPATLAASDTGYGNIWAESPFPAGLSHFPGNRLQPLFRKLGLTIATRWLGGVFQDTSLSRHSTVW